MRGEQLKNLIYTIVYNAIEEKTDRDYADQKETINNLRREIQEDYIPVIKGYRDRMDHIERMINAHAQGVDNVYRETSKLRSVIESTNLKKIIRYVEAFDQNKMTKEIQKIRDFMQDQKLESLLEEFEDFKYKLIELLEMNFKK